MCIFFPSNSFFIFPFFITITLVKQTLARRMKTYLWIPTNAAYFSFYRKDPEAYHVQYRACNGDSFRGFSRVDPIRPKEK